MAAILARIKVHSENPGTEAETVVRISSTFARSYFEVQNKWASQVSSQKQVGQDGSIPPKKSKPNKRRVLAEKFHNQAEPKTPRPQSGQKTDLTGQA